MSTEQCLCATHETGGPTAQGGWNPKIRLQAKVLIANGMERRKRKLLHFNGRILMKVSVKKTPGHLIRQN